MTSQASNLFPHADAYRAHLLLERRLATNTADGYLSDLRVCWAALGGRENSAPESLLTRENLNALFADFAALGLTPATLARYLAALRGYAEFLGDSLRQPGVEDNPLQGVRLPKAQRYKPRALSAKEMRDLYASVEARVATRGRSPSQGGADS